MRTEDRRLLGQTVFLMARHKNTSIFEPVFLPSHPREVR